MNIDEVKTIRDALIAAHVYVLHLPGHMFRPEPDGDCRRYECFACGALSGQNHKADCEVIALEVKLNAARDIATRSFDAMRYEELRAHQE